MHTNRAPASSHSLHQNANTINYCFKIRKSLHPHAPLRIYWNYNTITYCLWGAKITSALHLTHKVYSKIQFTIAYLRISKPLQRQFVLGIEQNKIQYFIVRIDTSEPSYPHLGRIKKTCNTIYYCFLAAWTLSIHISHKVYLNWNAMFYCCFLNEQTFAQRLKPATKGLESDRIRRLHSRTILIKSFV